MPLIPLADAGPILDKLEPRVLFSDIDGTLVGRGGSLFHTFEGELTLEPAKALFMAHQAGLRVVLMTGRPLARVREVARILGITDYIAEMGTALVIDGETEFLWGGVPEDLAPTPAEAMVKSGALGWLLDRYNGRVEPHEELPQERKGTILLRGQLELGEVNAELAAAGFGWAKLVDNGRFNRPFSHLGPGRTHAYHIAPVAAAKSCAVRHILKRVRCGKNQAMAIGDAPSDLEVVGAVGATFLVANGEWSFSDTEAAPIILASRSAGLAWGEVLQVLCSRLIP